MQSLTILLALLATGANALALGATRTGPVVMMAKSKSISVVLNQDITGVGTKGVVVQVKPAYAENVIIRGGLGKIATPDELAKIEKAQAEAAEAAKGLKKKAEAAKVTMSEKYANGLTFEVQPDEVITA